MKGGRDKRSVRVEFVLTEAEAALIKERMSDIHSINPRIIFREVKRTII